MQSMRRTVRVRSTSLASYFSKLREKKPINCKEMCIDSELWSNFSHFFTLSSSSFAADQCCCVFEMFCSPLEDASNEQRILHVYEPSLGFSFWRNQALLLLLKCCEFFYFIFSREFTHNFFTNYHWHDTDISISTVAYVDDQWASIDACSTRLLRHIQSTWRERMGKNCCKKSSYEKLMYHLFVS